VLLAVWLLAGVGARAESTNVPAGLPAGKQAGRVSFDGFRVISDRNIFNPNRFARSTGRASAESRPVARADAFTLVGLMAYGKGAFAFFDGTKADYRKTLEPGGTISEFTITGLNAEQVKLTAGTNEFVLKVGMQVRREDEGGWFVTKPGETPRTRVVVSRARTHTATAEGGLPEGVTTNGAEVEPEIIIMEPETAGSTEANGNTEAAPAVEPANNGNGVTDPVLIRLMQRRQELNR